MDELTFRKRLNRGIELAAGVGLPGEAVPESQKIPSGQMLKDHLLVLGLTGPRMGLESIQSTVVEAAVGNTAWSDRPHWLGLVHRNHMIREYKPVSAEH